MTLVVGTNQSQGVQELFDIGSGVNPNAVVDMQEICDAGGGVFEAAMADIRDLLANIRWSQEKYKPASLVHSKKVFPNIIKLTRITNGGREEELCRANGWIEQMRVMSRDKKGRLISFPLNFPVKFQVIRRGSQARIKMKTLKSLVKKGDLPITVRIDQNKSFHDDNGLGSTVMDDFTVMHRYLEGFLVCNAIKEGKLDASVTLVPQYADLEIEFCQGLIQGPKEHWRVLRNTFDFAARDIPFSKIQGSQAILLHTRESGVSSQEAAVRQGSQSTTVTEIDERREPQGERRPITEPLYAEVNKSRGDRQDDLFTRQLEAELTSETLESAVGQVEINSNSNNIEQKAERVEIVEAIEEQQTIEQEDQKRKHNSTERNSQESTLVRVGTVENVVTLGSESSSSNTHPSESSKQEGHDFNNNLQEADERLSEKFDDLYATVTRDQDKNNLDLAAKTGITTILVTADDNCSNIAYTHKDTPLSASTGNLQLAAQQEADQLRQHNANNSMASYRPRERVYSRDTPSELSQSGERHYGTALIHNGKSAVDYGTKDHNGKIPTFYSMTDLRMPSHQPRTQRSHNRRRMRRSEGSAQYQNQTLPPAITRIHTSSVMSGYEYEPRHHSASTLDNAELYKSKIYIPPGDDSIDTREPSQQMHIKVNKPRKNKVKSEQHQFSELRIQTNRHGVNENHSRPTGNLYNSGALHVSINGGERSNVWSPVSPTTSGSTASMTSPGTYSDDSREVDPRYVNGYDAPKSRQRESREKIVPQKQRGNMSSPVTSYNDPNEVDPRYGNGYDAPKPRQRESREKIVLQKQRGNMSSPVTSYNDPNEVDPRYGNGYDAPKPRQRESREKIVLQKQRGNMSSPVTSYNDPNEVDPRYGNEYDAPKPRQRESREKNVPQKQQGKLYQKTPQPRDQQKEVVAKKNRSAYNQRQQNRTRSSSQGSGSSYPTSSFAIEEEDFDIPEHITVNANYRQQQNRPRMRYEVSDESETDSDEDNMDDNAVIAEELAKQGNEDYYTRDKDYFYHTTGEESGMRKRSNEFNAAKERSQENDRAMSSNSVFVDDQSESSDGGQAVQDDAVVKADRKDFPQRVLNFAVPEKATKASTNKVSPSNTSKEVVEGTVKQSEQPKQFQAYKVTDRQNSASSKDPQKDSSVPSGERRISIINVGGDTQVAANSATAMSSPNSEEIPTSPNTEMRQIFGNIMADAKMEAFKEIDKMDDSRIQPEDDQVGSSQSITTHEQGNQRDVTVTMTGITSPSAQTKGKAPALDFSSELQQKLAQRATSIESSQENAGTTDGGYGYIPAGLSTLEREKGGYQIRASHGRLPSTEDPYTTKSGHVIPSAVSKDYYVAPSVNSSKASASTKSATGTTSATTTNVIKKTSSASKSSVKPAVEIHIENSSRSNSTKKVNGPKKSVAYPAVAKSESKKYVKEKARQEDASKALAPVMRGKEVQKDKIAMVKPTSQADKPQARPVSTISQPVDSTLPDQQEMETSHLETLHDSIKDLDDYLKSQDPDAISQISATSSRHMEHFNFTMEDGKSSEMTFF